MTKMKVEVLDRRQFVVASGAGAAAIIAGFSGAANATPESAMAYIKKITSGGSDNAMDGKIKIDLPEIAENGNTVPVKISVESPMSADDYVKAVHLVSEANPVAEVANYYFTPASGVAKAATRMRLAKTQNVIGVAVMSNGKIYMSKTQVKVTIGGCGG